MEVHELLGLPKRVEDLTDAELSAHLAHFFPATRPRTPISALITRAETTLKGVTAPATAPANANPTALAEAAKMAAAMAKLGLDPQGKPLPKKSSGKGSLL